MKLKIIMVGLILVGLSSVTWALTATYQTVCYVTCASDGTNTACGITECETITYYSDTGGGIGGGSGGPGGTGGTGGGGGNPTDNEVMSCWKEICASDRITSPFGVTRSGSSCGFHTGVDIGTALEGGKIPFRSMTSGTVVQLGYQAGGAGYYIKVRNDNGSYTVYGHLDGDESKGAQGFNNSSNITVGMRVVVGTTLGTTDTSGNTTGAHLDVKTYFEGQVSRQDAESVFGISLTSSDVRYCSSKGKTYVNSIALTGGSQCNS